MKNTPSKFTSDEVARDLISQLRPRRPCIELVDPMMARVLRAKTEWERLAIAAGMWRSARQVLQAAIQQEHPDWAADAVDREAARRMSNGVDGR
ncbi:MAG TPA: hypothetical protein VFI31_02010 [Pirellulales bacterium]|nr:hypothetical protein [Pirellulales bacterium]